MKRMRIVVGLLLLVALAWWQVSAPPSDESAARRSAPNTSSTSSTPDASGTSHGDRKDVRPPPPPLARLPDTSRSNRRGDDASDRLPDFLPSEARDTLALIARGGPFLHRQDGSTFQNRERRLPSRPRGYYREYTVRTPGEGDRGSRRIVTGGDPPIEFWYSADHYRSFRRFEVSR